MPRSSFPKPRLFLLILVMPGVLWCGVLAAGLLGLLAIQNNQEIARQDRELLRHGVEAINQVRAVQSHFKSQVQAWKNVLLRGGDPDKRAVYMRKFATEEQVVAQNLETLPPLLGHLGLEESAARRVQTLLEQHRALGIHYRSALHIYLNEIATAATAGGAAQVADAMVIGQDGATDENMNRLADDVNRHVERLVTLAAERDAAWFAEESAQVARILAGLGLVVLPLAFFTVRNHVIRPITRMTAAIEQVAGGNFKQRFPDQSMDELSRMSLSFNRMTEELDRIHSGLQHERDKLTTIIVAAQEGIVVTDRQGEVALINPSAERLLQKSAEQITREGFLYLLDDPEYLQAYLAQSGIDIPTTVVYHNRVLSVYANTIHTPDGVPIGSAALFRDVTEEKRLEKQLRTLSNTDALTGLHNRRRLDEILVDEFSRARRYQQSLALLMLDVDHFKRFNDTHGHDQGDRVLQAVAQVLRETCRDVDFPCRYGGEEFCLILPSTSLAGAERMAERLRVGIEAMQVDGLRVTASLGVAVYPMAAQTPETLQKAADAALYEAKKAGRNRFCTAQAMAS
ncbi:MAG: diguanylate cyclase [Magnetococcus sp. YQC-3]